jgi:DNA repair exonuclease SbcCD nuclease subunit
MDILKINPKNNKVLFFSDLHLGVHQDSQVWHEISLKLAEWIRGVMTENKLDTIFFAGDVFHDRHEIGVNTLYVAKKFFEILKDFNIHIIPGNHDAFLSSTVEVNSVEILARDNIFVYSTPTRIQAGEKFVTFCPWKTDTKQIEKTDMLIGHLEIANFKMNSTKICEKGDSSSDLLEVADAIITGHFHYREQRTYPNNKYVLYLGSPYEMDFSDRGQQKGVTIIDLDDLTKLTFIENTLTPKHIRLKISELAQKKYSDLPSLIKGNIVSVYVDTKLDTLTLDLLITKLTQYNPLQFKTEFNILDNAQIDTKEIKKLSIDIETAFGEFVEHVETRASKKEVLDKCIELYKICQTTHD